MTPNLHHTRTGSDGKRRHWCARCLAWMADEDSRCLVAERDALLDIVQSRRGSLTLEQQAVVDAVARGRVESGCTALWTAVEPEDKERA